MKARILSGWLVGDQILTSCNKIEVNYLKILQCDFLVVIFFRFGLSQLMCTYDENDRSLHSLSVGNLKKSAVFQILICPTVLQEVGDLSQRFLPFSKPIS